jgi:phenylacetic acid degradation operon negative regulatory protein
MTALPGTAAPLPAPVPAPVPDDIDARPGSAVSLLRTVVGLYLRRLGGWMPVAGLVLVLQLVGLEHSAARTAISRVKSAGLLLAETRGGVKGYALAPAAWPMLVAGDRRIFHPRRMAPGDPWCLISFSIPEGRRAQRHQLRRRLQYIGCGTVSAGLWICPASLAGEVEQILAELGVREDATLFTSTDPDPLAPAAWWDLDGLAGVHHEFLAAAEPLRAEPDPLVRYVRGIDLWRPIPYLDPGLSQHLLPADWPGRHSEQLYAEISELAVPAEARLEDLLRDTPALPEHGLRSRAAGTGPA